MSSTKPISTTLIDPFRQGIEITCLKHYDAGLVKIFSGDEGHEAKSTTYGVQEPFRNEDRKFLDVTKFNPVEFIALQDQWDQFYRSFLTYPIVIDDYDATTLFEKNGIIEPLTIRDEITFANIDHPQMMHSFKCHLMAGNVSRRGKSDIVTSIDYFEPQHQINDYLDLVDMFADIPTVEYFSEHETFIQPFNDIQLSKDFPKSPSLDNQMFGVLLTNTTGTCDSYIRYNQISATTGFTFDSVQGIGTDSIAFGGLTY